MNWLIRSAAALVGVAQAAWEKKGYFFALSLLIFVMSIVTLSHFDLLPTAKAPEPTTVVFDSPVATTDTTPKAPEDPVKISIDKIGLNVTVANPTSTDVPTLDAALLKGAVRYPTSAKLGQGGNVILFGHSSYLPVVHNQAYKAFDGIQNLVAGDLIMVYSSSQVYTYTVTGVAKESAKSGAIPLNVTGRVLTLATCDSFGAKTDRFVVTAIFVESHMIIGS